MTTNNQSLTSALLKTGWVRGCYAAIITENDASAGRIYFLPPTTHCGSIKFKDEAEIVTASQPISYGIFRVSYEEYVKYCHDHEQLPRLINGEKLTELSKRTAVPSGLPSVARYIWGPSFDMIPSVPVMARVNDGYGSPQVLMGYYSHAQNRWIIGLDWVGNPTVIEWWPIPESGTGIKPPQK